jgi:hypothetical protein
MGSRESCVTPGLAASSLACLLLFSTAVVGRAADLTLTPVADTALLEVSPNNNIGGQPFFSAGTTQNGPRTRGLVQFDFTTLPVGAVVQSAELVFEVTGQPVDGLEVDTFSLHRVLQAWGEGTKTFVNPASPGQGVPATAGEATWNQRQSGFATWAVPGGQAGVDFVAAGSTEQTIFSAGLPYSFPSTEALVADVQYWLAHPEANFGWMLKAQNEELRFTARRFGAHESEQDTPRLFLSYTVVPEPGTGVLLGLGLAGFVWAIRRQR